MVQSNLCNLCGMRKSEMYKRGEEANDFGGYFIVNGSEKLIRMLLAQVCTPSISHIKFLCLQKRHYIMALDRANFTKSGPLYTSKATIIRFCTCIIAACELCW